MQRIGEILIERGVIAPEQRDEALEIQDEKGGRIGEILLARKYLTPEELHRALAEQFALPFLDRLPEAEIDPALISGLPIGFAKAYKVLPISRDNGTIRVAVADPLELGPLDDVGILLDATPLAVVSTPQRIEDAINFVYDKAAEEQRRKEMIDGIDEDVDIGHALDHIEESEDILDSDEDAPIIRFVNTILVQAVKERASDIHIEPFERKISVRFRID
ncbi:MAG: type II secretion system protein GspE, partial [Deltaproteobacteria bacterium]